LEIPWESIGKTLGKYLETLEENFEKTLGKPSENIGFFSENFKKAFETLGKIVLKILEKNCKNLRKTLANF
jgi:hypothetical protein